MIDVSHAKSLGVCTARGAGARSAELGHIGFIGLGDMGGPMARNLACAGVPLTVWDRASGATRWFRDHHVAVCQDSDDLFENCSTIILMLANSEAVDEVLGRNSPEFFFRVRDRTIVNMGTVAPAFSEALAVDIRAADGRFVECAVWGSRLRAEEGTLVAMLAGDPDQIETTKDLMAPICGRTILCGPVPCALVMKLAVS